MRQQKHTKEIMKRSFLADVIMSSKQQRNSQKVNTDCVCSSCRRPIESGVQPPFQVASSRQPQGGLFSRSADQLANFVNFTSDPAVSTRILKHIARYSYIYSRPVSLLYLSIKRLRHPAISYSINRAEGGVWKRWSRKGAARQGGRYIKGKRFFFTSASQIESTGPLNR